MENKKDIGKAFRDKLDRLDRTGPQSGWNAISEELQQIKMQRRFPWRGIIGVSLLALLIGLIATYPSWQDDLPHIYMEMPEEHNAKKATPEENNNVGIDNNAKSEITEQPENISTTDNATQAVTKISSQPAHSSQDFSVKVDNIPSSAGAEPSAVKLAAIPLKTDENNNAPASEGKTHTMPDSSSSAAKPGLQTDNSEGKVKLLDLSKVSYGTENFTPKKEKKLDTRKIADSLNKLYDRANRIQVSFTIPATKDIKPGNRIFYIQIIDPNNKIINRKTTQVADDSNLAYSFISNVFYDNKAITLNETVTGKDFAKGLYRVNVFDNGKIVGTTTFTLK